ncbi:MAG: hypothetical protein HKN67_06090 [Saprospiraceae bacterium]|nr:hypothetical protein [Bacteroidia bacterium]NNF21491.1 hypothetical protein [Saprospiraceae bacterium]NNK90261.1 hypothetical protein [Saprospiraceae bacterium]
MDKLSAFGQMLSHLDNDLPLLKLEKAIGKFKMEVDKLNLLYNEELLLAEEERKLGSSNKIFSDIAEKERLTEDNFKKAVHDVYLTSIHDQEQLIANHLYALEEVQLRDGIEAYFREILENFEEQYTDFQEDTLCDEITEITNNLELLQGINSKHKTPESMQVFNELMQWKLLLQKAVICLHSVKDIQDKSDETIISTDLSREYYDIVRKLNERYEEFVILSARIMKLVKEWTRTESASADVSKGVPHASRSQDF